MQLGALVPSIVGTEGAAAARLDSITLGSAYQGIPHLYWFRAGALGLDPATSTVISLPVLHGRRRSASTTAASSFQAPAGGAATRRRSTEGARGYVLPGDLQFDQSGPDYLTLPGRGCVNIRAGFGDGTNCNYNGSRWFLGPSPTTNETVADPIAGNTANFSGAPMTNFNNAGGIAGVTTIFQAPVLPRGAWQPGAASTPASCPGAKRAADYQRLLGRGRGGRFRHRRDPQHPGALQRRPGERHVGHPQPRRADGRTARRERHAHRAGLRLCRAVPHLRGRGCSSAPTERGLRAEPDGDARARWASSAALAIRRPCPSCRRRVPGSGSTSPATSSPSSSRAAHSRPRARCGRSGRYVGAITGGQGAGGDQGPYAYSQPRRLPAVHGDRGGAALAVHGEQPGGGHQRERPQRGPHGARPLLREERVRGQHRSEGPEVRGPAASGPSSGSTR